MDNPVVYWIMLIVVLAVVAFTFSLICTALWHIADYVIQNHRKRK